MRERQRKGAGKGRGYRGAVGIEEGREGEGGEKVNGKGSYRYMAAAELYRLPPPRPGTHCRTVLSP